MGPWSSNSKSKIDSVSLQPGLSQDPILELWQGIGGSMSQWGYWSWTGTRVRFSNGGSTKAFVLLTHKGVNIPVNGKYTDSTYTEGIETYFYKPTYISGLNHFIIDLKFIFEQQFGSSSEYSVSQIEFVGQGQSGYGQHGWAIIDDVLLNFY